MVRFCDVLQYVQSGSRVKAYAWDDGVCITYFATWDDDKADDYAPNFAWGHDMAIRLADYKVVGISSEGGQGSIEFTLMK